MFRFSWCCAATSPRNGQKIVFAETSDLLSCLDLSSKWPKHCFQTEIESRWLLTGEIRLSGLKWLLKGEIGPKWSLTGEIGFSGLKLLKTCSDWVLFTRRISAKWPKSVLKGEIGSKWRLKGEIRFGGLELLETCSDLLHTLWIFPRIAPNDVPNPNPIFFFRVHTIWMVCTIVFKNHR